VRRAVLRPVCVVRHAFNQAKRLRWGATACCARQTTKVAQPPPLPSPPLPSPPHPAPPSPLSSSHMHAQPANSACVPPCPASSRSRCNPPPASACVAWQTPVTRAQQLCPDLLIIPPDFSKCVSSISRALALPPPSSASSAASHPIPPLCEDFAQAVASSHARCSACRYTKAAEAVREVRGHIVLQSFLYARCVCPRPRFHPGFQAV
jgi:hypothetical protein